MIKNTILKIDSISVMRSQPLKVLAVPSHINKKGLFWILMSGLVLFSGAYLYFLTQTVINTAFYQSIEKKIAVLNSEVGELESEYISLKKEINFELAEKLGFAETTTIKFVDKNITNQTLSLVK